MTRNALGTPQRPLCGDGDPNPDAGIDGGTDADSDSDSDSDSNTDTDTDTNTDQDAGMYGPIGDGGVGSICYSSSGAGGDWYGECVVEDAGIASCEGGYLTDQQGTCGAADWCCIYTTECVRFGYTCAADSTTCTGTARQRGCPAATPYCCM